MAKGKTLVYPGWRRKGVRLQVLEVIFKGFEKECEEEKRRNVKRRSVKREETLCEKKRLNVKRRDLEGI